MRRAITRNTILLVGSAPQYPNGVMDPIEKIAALALEKHLPLHVDSCLGGLILPWLKKSGYSIPDFDFRVKGVTSISADIHKYGFSQKGTAVILYRNESYRKYQIFTYTKWPGGLYASTTLLGSRNGNLFFFQTIKLSSLTLCSIIFRWHYCCRMGCFMSSRSSRFHSTC